MLRNTFFLIAVSLLNSANSLAQTKSIPDPVKKKNLTTGFYGKRFMLQLGGGMHHNTLLKITSSSEKNLRNTAYYSSYRNKIKSDQFNYSLYGNLGIVLKDRIALSLDFNYYTGNIFLTNVGGKESYDQWGNYIYIPGYDSRVKYTTLRIMPRIEIGSGGSNMPVGLVNVLGLGIELSKLKSGTYKSISAYDSYTYYNDSIQISNQRLKFDDEFSFNLTLMYGLEYRLAISKNIAWNFGGYVHLNVPIQELIADNLLGISNNSYNSNDHNEEYKLQMSRYRLQNLFSLRTGLVIML
nr:hypothetical protein [uncultured Fluviicola sp.]